MIFKFDTKLVSCHADESVPYHCCVLGGIPIPLTRRFRILGGMGYFEPNLTYKRWLLFMVKVLALAGRSYTNNFPDRS